MACAGMPALGLCRAAVDLAGQRPVALPKIAKWFLLGDNEINTLEVGHGDHDLRPQEVLLCYWLILDHRCHA